MEIEKLIHTSDGELKSEIPFWSRPCRVRLIESDTYSGFDLKIGETATIDSSCVERTRQEIMRTQGRSKFARIKPDCLIGPSVWIYKHILEEIIDG